MPTVADFETAFHRETCAFGYAPGICHVRPRKETSCSACRAADCDPACSRQAGHGSAGLARQRKRQVQLHPVVHHLRCDAAALAAFKADQSIPFHRPQRARQVRLGLAGDTASSSSEPGAFSAMTRSRSRFPAERTLANDSVEVNQTLGSSAATRATAMVAFISF
jgi:hypothetical protein